MGRWSFGRIGFDYQWKNVEFFGDDDGTHEEVCSMKRKCHHEKLELIKETGSYSSEINR